MAIQQTPELERAMQAGADQGATDVLLIPNEPMALRISGRIQRLESDILSASQIRRMAAAALGDEQLAKLPQVGVLATSSRIEGVVGGLMCVASTRGEITIVVRLLFPQIPDAASIGVPPVVLEMATARTGLMIFTGPPLSGKTTTMLSVLDEINSRQARHICTVEDPIKAMLTAKQSMIQQREVGIDVPDALAGIAAAVRQGADVLMVGELGCVEEVRACVTAAHLNHLVITQLHTLTPEASIQRLIEIQPPEQSAIFRRDLAQVLKCVVSQVLLERADGKELVASYGVLVVDQAMREAIAEGRPVLERAQPLPAGCQSLRDEVVRLQREKAVKPASAENALELLRTRG